jgi:hypothetical protein
MKKNSRVSPEARERIAAAQRERWKKHRENGGPPINQKHEAKMLLRSALILRKDSPDLAWSLVGEALKELEGR